MCINDKLIPDLLWSSVPIDRLPHDLVSSNEIRRDLTVNWRELSLNEKIFTHVGENNRDALSEREPRTACTKEGREIGKAFLEGWRFYQAKAGSQAEGSIQAIGKTPGRCTKRTEHERLLGRWHEHVAQDARGTPLVYTSGGNQWTGDNETQMQVIKRKETCQEERMIPCCYQNKTGNTEAD